VCRPKKSPLFSAPKKPKKSEGGSRPLIRSIKRQSTGEPGPSPVAHPRAGSRVWQKKVGGDTKKAAGFGLLRDPRRVDSNLWRDCDGGVALRRVGIEGCLALLMGDPDPQFGFGASVGTVCWRGLSLPGRAVSAQKSHSRAGTSDGGRVSRGPANRPWE
jgi:hypothetical protein